LDVDVEHGLGFQYIAKKKHRNMGFRFARFGCSRVSQSRKGFLSKIKLQNKAPSGTNKS